jgi:hypothetical protein
MKDDDDIKIGTMLLISGLIILVAPFILMEYVF